MGRTLRSCDQWIVGLLVVGCLLAGPAYADEPNEKKPNDRKPRELLDCRYQQGPEQSGDEATSEVLPADDVFRPLLADPQQPQTFALWQSQQSLNERTTANIGSVGAGGNFGVYARRRGCNGWQISFLGGVFAQFNLDTSNAELVNVDFNAGIPLTWRQGNWSARLRFYHQSSHIGDEFLGSNPGFKSIGLQFEEVDAIASYDFQRWLRLYGGGAVKINSQPSTLDRGTIHWGFEARTPAAWGRFYAFDLLTNPILFTPVLTGDFKSVEAQDWYINTNLLMGFDMSQYLSFRRVRILFNYYHGYNPYGQFFYSQKTQSFGIGVYFLF